MNNEASGDICPTPGQLHELQLDTITADVTSEGKTHSHVKPAFNLLGLAFCYCTNPGNLSWRTQTN